MSYTVKDRYQPYEGSGELIEVNVLKESYADWDYVDKVYEFVKDALDQCYQEGDFPGGILARKIETDAVLSCESPNYFQDGNEFLDDNGIYGDGSYLWVIGGCGNFFVAEAAVEGAWQERRQAFIDQSTRPSKRLTAIQGIHEALHPYLHAENCNEVIQQVLSGEETSGNSNDHGLGMVRPGLIMPSMTTPMLNYYGQAEAETGDCSNWESDHDHGDTLAECTIEALELSRDHSLGQH
ncbi:hypothetical protein [Haloglomus litoreum]|uniref:hypothetical protein n=1 Tax=Haloglomus litoreum TaxID=3034026 RepID=UPI0023E89072|nr:hypothetical protein [Haloglomus sp. DT116]